MDTALDVLASREAAMKDRVGQGVIREIWSGRQDRSATDP